jgi:capsular polysaccharide biosynthesis protein
MKDHIEDLRVLRSAYVEEYPLDASLPPQFRRAKAFEERHIYQLRDVCVSPRTGLCWLPKGPILGESVGSLIRLLGWDAALLEEPLLKPRAKVQATVVVLSSHGYFHWLFECLPTALHALTAEPNATVLVPCDAPRYVREALELLALPSVSYTDGPIVAERLVLVARDGFSGFVPREDIEVLRSILLPAVSGPPSERVGLYVSRRLSSRSLVNESELEREVERLGFDVVSFQDISLSDQIRLSRDSRIMIGPHGAGLGNLVFGNRLGHILELFSPDYFNDCYARLAASRRISYMPFFCAGSNAADGVAQTSKITSAIRDILARPA